MSRKLRACFSLILFASVLVSTETVASASSCSFDQMVARDNPALWFNFDASGVPINQGTGQTSIKLEGDDPEFGEKTRCGSGYRFKAFGGRYKAQGLPPGTISDGEFTIEAAIKIPRQITVTYPTIFNVMSPAWSTLRVRTTDGNAGKVEYAVFNPGEQGFYSPGRVDDDKFHLLTVVHKSSRVRFYIDGVLDFERAVTGPFNLDDSPLYIGGSGSANETFPGLMDHFAIYSSPLSDAEINLRFQAYLKDFYEVNQTPASNAQNGTSTQVSPPETAPQGFNLTPFASGLTASWIAEQGDTTTVKAEINCATSGVKSSSIAARQREISFQGLTPGEVCSGQIYAQNAGGTSPPSQRIGNVIVKGAAPISPTVSSATINGTEVSVNISNVDANATEVLVELTCTKSAPKSITTTPKNPTVSFGSITTGDICYATATARNLWGSAPRGSNSNNVALTGDKPQPLNYTTQTTMPGELKISWPAQSASDVNVSISLTCVQSNKATQEMSISQLQALFTKLVPGDTCSSTVITKNAWGSSPPVTKESILITGNIPVGAPEVKMARVKATTMALSWEANASAKYMNIRVFCTVAGNKSIDVQLPITETEISGKDGDSCYTIMRWANSWGYATETVNTPLLKLSNSIVPPASARQKLLCVKGKSSLTIVGKNPICPKGYKKKTLK